MRKAFAFVAATMAKQKAESNGSLRLGKALSKSYPNENEDEQAIFKLHRLIKCDSMDELCLILRPLLQLIHSRGHQLDYAKLLNDLSYFNKDSAKVGKHWAQQFYYTDADQEERNVS